MHVFHLHAQHVDQVLKKCFGQVRFSSSSLEPVLRSSNPLLALDRTCTMGDFLRIMEQSFPAHGCTKQHPSGGQCKRYLGTLHMLEPYLRPNMHVLDVGANDQMMQRLFDHYELGITVENLVGDIRYPWRVKRDRYNLVISMEVIEHLKDWPIAGLNELQLAIAFHYIGMWNFFIEARNLLQAEDLLLVTTPNAGSYLALYNLMAHQSPDMYYIHVHELSMLELISLHEGAGFKILRKEARYANRH